MSDSIGVYTNKTTCGCDRRTQEDVVETESTQTVSPIRPRRFKLAKWLFERRYAIQCLSHAHGNVAKAARISGKDRKDFYVLLERTGLRAADFRR